MSPWFSFSKGCWFLSSPANEITPLPPMLRKYRVDWLPWFMARFKLICFEQGLCPNTGDWTAWIMRRNVFCSPLSSAHLTRLKFSLFGGATVWHFYVTGNLWLHWLVTKYLLKQKMCQEKFKMCPKPLLWISLKKWLGLCLWLYGSIGKRKVAYCALNKFNKMNANVKCQVI